MVHHSWFAKDTFALLCSFAYQPVYPCSYMAPTVRAAAML